MPDFRSLCLMASVWVFSVKNESKRFWIGTRLIRSGGLETKHPAFGILLIGVVHCIPYGLTQVDGRPAESSCRSGRFTVGDRQADATQNYYR
jgi:hypothetical protein